MIKRKPPRPKWTTEYLQLPAWTQREFLSLLCGLRPSRPTPSFSDPQKDRERFDKARQRFVELGVRDEKARAAADQHVKRAILAGDLEILPSLWDKKLLDDIKPHVGKKRLAEIHRAVATANLYGDAYYVAPAAAIRWAVSTGLFPNFPFSLEDIVESDRHPAKVTDRRQQVEDFLDRCNALADVPRKILRKDIWRAARHKTGRQFQRWQAEDRRTTPPDERVFSRLMSIEPKEFVEILTRQKVM